jgi:uncharacterized protein YyaL (SSP411 family)
VRDRFVPVRVDTDRRPEINDRYNLGGWPTTAFLTPGGEILGGGTFIPADRLVPMLAQVADAYVAREEELRTKAEEVRARRTAERAGIAGGELPDLGAPEWLADRLVEAFDPAHGGFGVEPKYPHAPALVFALRQWRRTGDSRLEMVVRRSLEAMASGGLHDDVEGGFFRYATTRDWALPHTEKILEENAALIRLYLEAAAAFRHPPYAERALDALRYVDATLTDPVDGGFYASQRANRRYYSLPTREARRSHEPPEVDRTIYAGANAAMAAAWLDAAVMTGDTSLRDAAIRAVERVVLGAYRPGSGLAHALGPRAQPPLLADHVAMSGLLLDLAEATGQRPYLELSQELMYYALRTMWDGSSGGFFDVDGSPEGREGDVGLLREPLKPSALNAEAARVLIRLARSADDPSLRDRAVETLAAVAPIVRTLGLLAAPYGLAILELQADAGQQEKS